MTEEPNETREVNGAVKVANEVSAEQDDSISQESLLEKTKKQQLNIFSLEEKVQRLTEEKSGLQESLDQKRKEFERFEHDLLTSMHMKESELQDLMHHNEELKASASPCNQQLRCMSLDPAVNIVFQRIKKEMQECKEKMEQTQNDLQAWKFTPDSQIGKRMMNRIRVLLQENEELGQKNQSGRTAKLESEIAMKKALIEELKRSNQDMEEIMEEMDTETDGLQNTVFLLQQQLVLAKSAIDALSSELETVRPGRAVEVLNSVNWQPTLPLEQEEAGIEEEEFKDETMECSTGATNGEDDVMDTEESLDTAQRLGGVMNGQDQSAALSDSRSDNEHTTEAVDGYRTSEGDAMISPSTTPSKGNESGSSGGGTAPGAGRRLRSSSSKGVTEGSGKLTEKGVF